MSQFLYGSICLTDIPKELITKSEKNGKQYLNIAVSELKEKGKFGDTHLVTVSVPKEQRRADERTPIIGNLKTWDGNTVRHQGTIKQTDDDLPF